MTPAINYSEFTTFEGVDLEIKGEVFDEPIPFPNQDIVVHNKISFISQKTKHVAGVAFFEHPFTKEQLIEHVKIGKANPSLAIDASMMEIIKRSKDYTK